MGLDMFLYRQNKQLNQKICDDENCSPVQALNKSIESYYKNHINEIPVELNYKECVYWRKANHIHNWFVENVQKGNDDCDYYLVTVEQLELLLALCRVVQGDFKKAESVLPTVKGFSFGSTNYDSRYLADIENTVDILSDLLSDKTIKLDLIFYHSSW